MNVPKIAPASQARNSLGVDGVALTPLSLSRDEQVMGLIAHWCHFLPQLIPVFDKRRSIQQKLQYGVSLPGIPSIAPISSACASASKRTGARHSPSATRTSISSCAVADQPYLTISIKDTAIATSACTSPTNTPAPKRTGART